MLGTAQRTQMLAQEGLLAQLVKACSRVYDRIQKWNEMTPGECAPMFQAASLLVRRCGPNLSSNPFIQRMGPSVQRFFYANLQVAHPQGWGPLRAHRAWGRGRCERSEPRSQQGLVMCADPG